MYFTGRMYVLYLVPTTPDVKVVYEAVVAAYLSKPLGERDAGVDLVSPATVATAGTVAKISQQCSAALYDTTKATFRAYWMLPRSSLSKTPLRLANSVGLIDAGYRGPLLAAVDVRADTVVEANTRLFQIAAPDLLPFEEIKIVSDIPGGPTLRGEGGFGSTGNTVTLQASSVSPGYGYFTAP